MSWIKVKKDTVELLVSEESYRDLFSKQGYEIIREKPIPTQPLLSEKQKEIKEKEPKNNELHSGPRITKNGSEKKGQSKIS